MRDYIGLLDKILLAFYNAESKILNNLYEQEFKDVDEKIFFACVNKLIDDDYIEVTSTHDSGVFRYRACKIAFKGIILSESGGYAQKFIWENAENKRIEQLEINQRKIQQRVFWLTVIVAVGTFFQALLAVADLYWKYHWFH